MTALARRHRVHRIDLPGHGLSGGTAVGDFDAAACEIARALPPRCVVAGWSLGGLFAQRMAGLEPERIAGMVLVSSTPCFVQRPGWQPAMRPQTVANFARDLERAPQATLEQFVRLNALHGTRPLEAARALHSQLRERPAPSREALEHGLRWLREVDLRDAASDIVAPCVVVHGTRDAITPVEAGRWLARQIDGARLVEIEDAAHLPFVSHPERFLDAVEMLHG